MDSQLSNQTDSDVQVEATDVVLDRQGFIELVVARISTL